LGHEVAAGHAGPRLVILGDGRAEPEPVEGRAIRELTARAAEPEGWEFEDAAFLVARAGQPADSRRGYEST
jgi:hypothetical protein